MPIGRTLVACGLHVATGLPGLLDQLLLGAVEGLANGLEQILLDALGR